MSIKNGRKEERRKRVGGHAIDRCLGLSEVDLSLDEATRRKIEKVLKKSFNENATRTDMVYLKDVLTRKERRRLGIPCNAFVTILKGRVSNILVDPAK